MVGKNKAGARRPLPKGMAAGGIALLAVALVLSLRWVRPFASAVTATNHLFYDIYYRLRPIEDRKSGSVVIIAADQNSLTSFNKIGVSYPWPRAVWGEIATYVSKAGAEAIGFDMLFTEISPYHRTGDDATFKQSIAAVRTPVIFSSAVNRDGSFQHFDPPISNPHLAAVNMIDPGADTDDPVMEITDLKNRTYLPMVMGKDSFATAIVKAVGKPMLPTDQSFLMHYFGPNKPPTYRYFSAEDVYEAAHSPANAAQRGVITPDLFQGKIVLIGLTMTAGFDLKPTPLTSLYPGVEVQATAIENLLLGQQVTPLAWGWQILIPLLCGLTATFGAIYPRQASMKLLWPTLAVILLFGIGIVLFRAATVRWMPPAESLLVLVLATPSAFAYTYLAEDRQRRFMLNALSKIVSPAIADQLSDSPERLKLGTVRTELTVLFTDLANFTSLSESMPDQELGEVLNRYLGEMSDQVLINHGTLDKYIGDAVMCFWNAPLPQQDHAVLACRAALAMARREEEIKTDLGDIGKKLFTRIGINTTFAAVGFVGSSHLFNYTALGDGVNLASRLEGANKLYGTQIVISESTALLVQSQFFLRKLDLLQVVGKSRPIAVYELIAERTADAASPMNRITAYESALTAYQRQEWDTAEKILLELAATIGEDAPSRVLLKRIAAFRVAPPSADWDGTFEAKNK